MLELRKRSEFLKWLKSRPENHPAAIQDLDLSKHAAAIQKHRFPDSIFLGCEIPIKVAGHIVNSGGVVIPDLSGFLFSVHRSKLYSVDELFAGFCDSQPRSYQSTYDWKVYYQYFCEHGEVPKTINVSLARRLHDHSITEALYDEIEGRKVVAMMGGHGMERNDPFYAKVAHISRRLTQEGFLMVSGGGPGAMEATHLGAYFANRTEKEMRCAIEMIKPRPHGASPGKEYADPDWLHRAWSVIETFPLPTKRADLESTKSIGIPTWHYGHEPPAPFATHIAKYFANSVREDGLLAIANHGVIFAPGSAGTTQEIFQDAAQNHYGSQGIFSPMILFGEDHWTKRRPVWPLISAVAKGKEYGELLALTDCEEEIIRRIKMFDPAIYAPKKDPNKPSCSKGS